MQRKEISVVPGGDALVERWNIRADQEQPEFHRFQDGHREPFDEGRKDKYLRVAQFIFDDRPIEPTVKMHSSGEIDIRERGFQGTALYPVSDNIKFPGKLTERGEDRWKIVQIFLGV